MAEGYFENRVTAPGTCPLVLALVTLCQSPEYQDTCHKQATVLVSGNWVEGRETNLWTHNYNPGSYGSPA